MENKYMTDDFTVIDGNKDIENVNRIMRTIAFHDCWRRQYESAIHKVMSENPDKKIPDYPQDDLMKIVYAGIKYVNYNREIKRENTRMGTGYEQTIEEAKAVFGLMDVIFMVMGYIKLKNLVTTFPITKDFDGAKWECKDYFYTMEELSRLDWDKPLGRAAISELLWDYENEELRNAYIEYMNAASDIYKSQTGKGMAEEWFEKQGLPTYTYNEEIGVLKNNQTGEIQKISNTPSYLQIVK